MKIFALDTTARSVGIGLMTENGNRYYRSENEGNQVKMNNSVLMQDIEKMLDSAQMTIADFDYFAVNVGPGSFTGIRIGVATINAFATATAKPVIEIVSLEQKDDGSEKVVLLDCKHNNFYAGIFGKEEAEYREMKQEEAESLRLPLEYIIDAEPELLLAKAAEKARKGETVYRAKPFYLKKSSAETGIQ